MDLSLSRQFLKDIKSYQKERNIKALAKVWELVLELEKYPSQRLEGKGKPEKLKHLGAEIYSRRIDGKNRLVYRYKNDGIDFISCLGHYDNL